jgi:hypothetical protein
MSRGRLVLLGLVTIAAAAQAVQPNRTNPTVEPGRTVFDHLIVSGEVAAILRRSCWDCHSHETRWPWYAYVAPVSWWIASDVREARDHMNLTDWAAYSREDSALKLGKMCEEVREGRMPLRGYRLLHPRAGLSRAEVDTLCAWTRRETDRLLRDSYGRPGPRR